MILKTVTLDTPLGQMVVIADEQALYMLEFADCKDLEKEITRLQQKTHATIVSGRTHAIDLIEQELNGYFAGTLHIFTTPLYLFGSPFQKRVWQELQKIPFGQTRSYAHIAAAIEKPSAFRAVAQANGANLFPIIIPCHRVIQSNGKLGGYSGTLMRKQWLVDHEKQVGEVTWTKPMKSERRMNDC